MPVIPSSVLLVIKKFPEYKGVIQRLFKSNNEFLILCEDYRMCKEALAYWKISISNQAPLRVKEYQSLLEELKNEILLDINNFK